MRMTPAAPSSRLKGMNKSILCYVGSLNPQDGVDYLLRSLRHLLHGLKRSDFYCVIMEAETHCKICVIWLETCSLTVASN